MAGSSLVRSTSGDSPKIRNICRAAATVAAASMPSVPARTVTSASVTAPSPSWSAPASTFSIGVNQGLINSRQRANDRDLGGNPSNGESAVEITYADKIGEHLTLQPDLQFIHNPGADQSRDAVVVATLRATVEY